MQRYLLPIPQYGKFRITIIILDKFYNIVEGLRLQNLITVLHTDDFIPGLHSTLLCCGILLYRGNQCLSRDTDSTLIRGNADKQHPRQQDIHDSSCRHNNNLLPRLDAV